MTIATILPGILAECGIDRTAPDIAENTFEMRQILALMNAAGKDINRRAEWTGAAATFTVVSANSASLPSDFQEMAEGGAVLVGSSGHMPARPVLSPEMWQMLERFPSEQVFYHLKDGKIYLSETVATATIRYVSLNWVPGKSEVTTGTDQPIFPEHLLARGTIWRFKRQKGLPYDDIVAEFEADLEAAIKANRGAA